MKRAVVIGGNGKVGGYLCPMLVAEGYQVTAVSRSENPPPVWMPGYEAVERVRLCRGEPGFEAAVAALRPDVVVDMICFTQEEMQAMVDALRGKVAHYLCCGSAWIHGPVRCVPAREEEDRVPLCEYGRQKSAMEETLAALWREEGFPGTMVHPGHIVCPNTWPINPQAHKEPWVFDVLREGRPLALPDLGMGTLHHVHAADVAGVFLAAIRAGEPSFGQGFHAVSPGPLPCEAMPKRFRPGLAGSRSWSTSPWESGWRDFPLRRPPRPGIIWPTVPAIPWRRPGNIWDLSPGIPPCRPSGNAWRPWGR